MKDHTLMQIANGLCMNVQKMPNAGLLEGKTGVAMFLYRYARYTGRTAYSQLADYLMEEILEATPVMNISFSAGLSGVGWGFNYLMKEDFCEVESDIFDYFDNRIIGYVSNLADEYLPDGCLYLATCRTELLDETLAPVIARQLSGFLSSDRHPLAVLNKLLALAVHVPRLCHYTWFDLLTNAMMDAMDAGLYRRSDLMVYKDILEVSGLNKENADWQVLYDKCKSLSVTIMGTSKNSPRHAELDSASPCFQEIADHVHNDGNAINRVFRSPLISQTDRLETVWQYLVYLGSTNKRKCDIARIATTVAEIIKEINIQDMYFSSGLPAMGMDILL